MLHYVHKMDDGKIERMVGLFALYAAGMLVATLLVIGGQQKFLSHYPLKAELAHGYGLKPGTPINVIGMEVGKVDSIRFNEQNRVEIGMSLKKEYRDKIRKDSRVRVVNLDLMGNMALEISMGSLDKPILKEGEIIRGADLASPENISVENLPLLAKANAAMDTVAEVVQNLSAPLKKLDAILNQLEGLAGAVNAGEGSLGAFVRDDSLHHKFAGVLDTSQRLATHLEGTTGNIQTASKSFLNLMENGERSMVEIQKSVEKLPEIAQDWKELMAHVQQSVGKMHAVMEEGGHQITLVKEILKDFKQASENLPRMVETTRENIDEITRIIEGAEKNWIVKGFIERENTAPPIVLEARDNHYGGPEK